MKKTITVIAASALLAACGQSASDKKPMTAESGLQYKVLASGPEDGISPTPGQIVCVHYRGTFTSGEEFDSSYSRNLPTAFPSNGVIAGWVEALAMMRPGDKWQLTIPPELAYGSTGTPGGSIGPDETLMFDVELLKVLDISMQEYMQTYRMNPTLDCSKP
ncbi:MAG: FKBP-type peptidyl-prolyl cis-trans isomerase [Robiginitomaculum sp.]|nr:FKBP-type peptidyl-prolyl cis-trans isomerase [Robiginitomaculum sp.]